MTKSPILQEIFYKWVHTIGRLNQADVCTDIGMDKWQLNKYVSWIETPSDKMMDKIKVSCRKIAKSKYDFIISFD